MYERTDTEIEAIQELLSPHFGTDFEPDQLANSEDIIIQQILEYVSSRFTRMKYILGLALDFAIVSQRLSNVDDSGKRFREHLTIEQLFQRYQVVTERGEQQANTLTLKFGQSTQVGIQCLCLQYRSMAKISRFADSLFSSVRVGTISTLPTTY
jgi:hypothetical protein